MAVPGLVKHMALQESESLVDDIIQLAKYVVLLHISHQEPITTP